MFTKTKTYRNILNLKGKLSHLFNTENKLNKTKYELTVHDDYEICAEAQQPGAHDNYDDYEMC